MSAISIVITKLKATAAVTSKVPAAKIFPLMFPQNTAAPAITVNTVGDTDPQMLSGAAAYYDTRVRIEMLAEDPTSVVAIGDAVRAALQDVLKATIAGYHDVDITYTTYFTDWADDRSLARYTSDFSVRWRQ